MPRTASPTNTIEPHDDSAHVVEPVLVSDGVSFECRKPDLASEKHTLTHHEQKRTRASSARVLLAGTRCGFDVGVLQLAAARHEQERGHEHMCLSERYEHQILALSLSASLSRCHSVSIAAADQRPRQRQLQSPRPSARRACFIRIDPTSIRIRAHHDKSVSTHKTAPLHLSAAF